MRRRFFSNNKISVIKYLSTDLSIVIPYNRNSFDKKIKSNTYSDTGVIEFYGILTLIGSEAFWNCTSLTSVTIPDSVTSIGNYAFAHCTSLKEVYCKPTTPPSGSPFMFYDNASGRKIYVPLASVAAYKTASYWSEYAYDIVGYDFENNTVV